MCFTKINPGILIKIKETVSHKTSMSLVKDKKNLCYTKTICILVRRKIFYHIFFYLIKLKKCLPKKKTCM